MSEIEPVTDEDVLAAVNLPARALEPHTRRILEQDRRRVAERQANHGTTHAEGCVSWGRGHYECAMVEIERLRAEVAKLRAQMDADLATYTETMEEATATMARAEAELVASSAEVARLTAANKWRPIKTAPKDGTVILIHVPNARLLSMARADDLLAKPYWLEGASHWMPLPEPPKENSNG